VEHLENKKILKIFNQKNVNKGESVFILASLEEYQLKSTENAEPLEVYIKN